MVADIVRDMGYLCLGSRLKRIGESLQADLQRVIDEAGLPLQTSQFPLLAALDRLGPLTVGQLVEAVGVSQPGVTRNVSLLAKAGLVTMTRDKDDQRKKTVALTQRGEGLVAVSKRAIWPGIGEAVAELCEGLSGPLLDQLAALEDGLRAAPLDRRFARRAESASS